MKTLLVYAPLTFDKISSKTFKSFIAITGPDAQAILKEKYEIDLKILICDKFPIDLNRNYAFDIAQSATYEADYVFCADMDQVFKKDTITKLLDTLIEHPESGGATGVYWTKSYPHRAVVGKYSPWSENIEMKRKSLESEGFIAPGGMQTLYFKHLQYFDVIQPVDVFGLGCLLIKTEILRKIKQPYCKYVNAYSTGGDFTFLGHSEDMWFCSQLKQAGITILVNPKVQVGHVVEKVICGNEAEE